MTPPFAGYLSGHSTFSRAASEVLTLFTGDAFFPGGMGVFDALQNDFLVFEEGPSTTIELQWATYRDASDQTSLSRIWGGIHPPIDDIRGRIIGDKIGNDAYNLALDYFNGTLNTDTFDISENIKVFPIPFDNQLQIVTSFNENLQLKIYGLDGKEVLNTLIDSNRKTISTQNLASGLYFAKFLNAANEVLIVKKVVKN